MVELEKIQSDIKLMRRRIDSFNLLEEEYGAFVAAMPQAEKLPEEARPSKVIWTCWLQGIENAPDIVRACYASLMKRFPEYEKILVTQENFRNFVTIPDHVIGKWQAGIITSNGFANILRLALLLEHGGLWLDATVLSTTKTMPSYITGYPFFAYSSWNYLTGDIRPISNWCLASCPNHPLLRAVYVCLLRYWQDHEDLLDYFIFHMFFRMAISRYPDLWSLTPRISNLPPHLMQFELDRAYREKRFNELQMISAFHKLTWRIAPEIKANPHCLYHRLVTYPL